MALKVKDVRDKLNELEDESEYLNFNIVFNEIGEDYEKKNSYNLEYVDMRRSIDLRGFNVIPMFEVGLRRVPKEFNISIKNEIIKKHWFGCLEVYYIYINGEYIGQTYNKQEAEEFRENLNKILNNKRC